MPQDEPRKQRCSVFLVDPELPEGERTAAILAELGHRVAVFSRGRDAVAAFPEHDLQVLITDLAVPDLDGFSLMRLAEQYDPFISSVALTCKPAYSTAVEAMRYGAVDYLEKPVLTSALMHAVRRALEARWLKQERARGMVAAPEDRP